MPPAGASTLPVPPLRIAIASGKGGTGKTTVAASLAWLAAQCGWPAAYVDCDTEEPNGHLFLRPAIQERREVTRPVPQIDAARCSHCGECGQICQFSALVCLENKVLSFPELCHSCGGCALVCPARAIRETPRAIGMVETGMAGLLRVVQGSLRVGEASSPPVIRAVKQAMPQDGLCVIDAPPGTSCPMMETVRDTQYVLLVTEATPFGLHDLRLAVQALRPLDIPCGVVINRATSAPSETRVFCQQSGLPILQEIPDMLSIAQAYSQGQLLAEALPEMRPLFARLLARLAETLAITLPDQVRSQLEAMAAQVAHKAQRPSAARQSSGYGEHLTPAPTHS